MIVIAESNFVIELAYRQDEIEHVEAIVNLAERHEVELAIPACALFEPYETLVRRRKQRMKTIQKLREEISQLGRSQHFADLPLTSEAISQTLSGSAEIEHRELDQSLLRLAKCATVIPLSGEMLKNSVGARLQFSLEPQDSIIFASVEHFLKDRGGSKSVFANKNSADFSGPEIESHLRGYGCKLLSSFANTRKFVEHSLASEDKKSGGIGA
jgi:predicted nucleic acid-binding protein